MKNFDVLSITLTIILALSFNAFGADTHSGQAIQNTTKAGSHGSASAGHAIGASGQATSAAAAVPLAVGGSAGAASNKIAKDLINAATAPIGTPLVITDETITVGPPPDEALAPKNTNQ